MERRVTGLLAATLAVAALGGFAKYLLDAEKGKARRASLRARLASARRSRRRGRDGDLLQRVREAIAAAVSHPSMVGAWAQEGRVLLHGDVLADEHERLLASVTALAGITEVSDHLRRREHTDRIWALERPLDLQLHRLDFASQRWSRPTRLLGGLAGLALLGAALRDRRTLLAPAAAIGGSSLLLRSLANRPLGQLGPRRGMYEVSAFTEIGAPVERVFRVVSAWERFPTFMRNVHSVTRYDDGTSHWAVGRAGGALVEWNSVITVHRSNELLAWRSLPGSRTEHCGVIHFEPLGPDTTRVRVHMSYRPPLGALGHFAARAWGLDAGPTLEEALSRLKHFIEDWDTVGAGARAMPPRAAEPRPEPSGTTHTTFRSVS